MSELCIMFSFSKVETSEKKVDLTSPPVSDSMDRTEHLPITVSEVNVETNPIDYDSDDEFDEEVAEINSLFESKPIVIETQETVSSLELEKESKETSDSKEEIKVEEECFGGVICNLLSKCFNKG